MSWMTVCNYIHVNCNTKYLIVLLLVLPQLSILQVFRQFKIKQITSIMLPLISLSFLIICEKQQFNSGCLGIGAVSKTTSGLFLISKWMQWKNKGFKYRWRWEESAVHDGNKEDKQMKRKVFKTKRSLFWRPFYCQKNRRKIKTLKKYFLWL